MAKKANKAAEEMIVEAGQELPGREDSAATEEATKKGAAASDSAAAEAASMEQPGDITMEEETNEADGLPIYHAPEGAEEE